MVSSVVSKARKAIRNVLFVPIFRSDGRILMMKTVASPDPVCSPRLGCIGAIRVRVVNGVAYFCFIGIDGFGCHSLSRGVEI